MNRDQERARHAYQAAAQAKSELKDKFEDYKGAVKDLGADILRNGLAAAVSTLERDKSRQEVRLVFRDLASAGIPHFEECTGESLPSRIRELETAHYMLATRETLKFVVWLKRAVEAKGDQK
ncbi:MAG: type III-B CRISPR module-associated protein Cmr5 [Candidatus Sericytochromatia bacterium]|nr:type III-B CRISPR module-associated protein Cmr5 [Candidatus Tanganyikabacteria bacterium]